MIIFTDKKVYGAWAFGGAQADGNPPSSSVAVISQNLTISVYAVVLDDDGKPLSGQTVNATIVDEKHLDHYNKGDNTVHHVVNTDVPSLFNLGPISLTYNNGVYSKLIDIPDINLTTAQQLSMTTFT